MKRPRNRFADLPAPNIGRSKMKQSWGRKMTFDADYIYPIMWDDVLPGDTIKINLNGFARIFSPLDAPVMDNLECETFFFFVPNRILWTNWKYFMGEHDDQWTQDTTYTEPRMADGTTVDHSGGAYALANLAAYLGLPEGLSTTSVHVRAAPFRAYAMCYNEFFRDQNLIDSVGVGTGDGPDTSTYALKKSAKRHDYFTSCLPDVQKGTAQTVSLVGNLDVRMTAGTTGDPISLYADDAGTYRYIDHDGAAGSLITIDSSADADGSDSLYVDSSGATVDINDLRYAVAIQRLLERDARGGTRYTEQLKAHWGVDARDYRLQRPEYLGGAKTYINISPVANTSPIKAASAPGAADEYTAELKGIGAGRIKGGFIKSFTEHGILIGLIRVRGDVTYFQGVDRKWLRSSRYDHYIPALANIGEMTVTKKEIFVTNDGATTDDTAFGYQEAWSEYRYKKSELVGMFNPDVAGALDHWHLAQDFGATAPSLNGTFVQSSTPMSRIQAFTTADDFIADMWFDATYTRPMPIHSIPGLVARF